MLENVSMVPPETDPVFGLENILLVAADSTALSDDVAQEFGDFFDEIITVTEMREVCRILKIKRVSHLVISESFCRDLEGAELIRDWKNTYPDMVRAVFSTPRDDPGERLDIEVDAPVCCSHCCAKILCSLFLDSV